MSRTARFSFLHHGPALLARLSNPLILWRKVSIAGWFTYFQSSAWTALREDNVFIVQSIIWGRTGFVIKIGNRVSTAYVFESPGLTIKNGTDDFMQYQAVQVLWCMVDNAIT